MNTEEKRMKFWKMLSSELRTPLNVIKGVTDICRNEIYDIDNVTDGLAKIEECSNTLLSIVNNIVDYSAIENNEVIIDNKEFDFKGMITGMAKAFYLKAREEGKCFEVVVKGVTDERVSGDLYRVERILNCLLGNTFFYTESGAYVHYYIEQINDKSDVVHFRISAKCSGKTLYEKLNETVNESIVTEHTDIELYNCYHILNRLGGSIAAIADGSDSEIYLDMYFDKVMQPDEYKDYSENDARLIILSDDRDLAMEKSQILDTMHISYDVISDSEEALNLIGQAESENRPYNMCIVNWNIKNINVQEFINDIHNIFGMNFSIIASAFDAEAISKDAARQGFNQVIENTWFASEVQRVLDNNDAYKNNLGPEDKADIKDYDFSERRVLVAEDAVLNMEVIVKMLSKVNIQVTSVVNGVEAVRIFESRPQFYFDCILMDVNMPMMNGYEAVRMIRRMQREDAEIIPIYALTANVFQTDIDDALEAGMNGHISKPVDVKTLYELLDGLFSDNDNACKDTNAAETAHMDDSESEYDELTGLINEIGIKNKLNSLYFADKPMGLIVLEVNGFRPETPEDKVRDILVMTAECLKKKFRSTDIIIKYPGECFAVILRNYMGNTTFIERKIKELEYEISQCGPDGTGLRIMAGVAFSLNGYTDELIHASANLLDKVRKTKISGCIIQKEYVGVENGDIRDAAWYRNIYGTEMYFVGSDNGIFMDNKENFVRQILGKNRAVGIVCGFYDEELTLYSVSGFALENLGFDYEGFMSVTGGKFEKLIYKDDVQKIHDCIQDKDVTTGNIRLLNKAGDICWFFEAHINFSTPDGRKLWMMSLRMVDDDMLGNLCNIDYSLVGVIYCSEDVIFIEKGTDILGDSKLNIRRKYNYSSFVSDVLKKNIRMRDQDEFLSQMKISNLRHNLEAKGMYEFITYLTKTEDELLKSVRYKFRYMDESKNVILCTQEYMERFAESDDVTELMNEKGFYGNARRILDSSHPKDAFSVLFYDIKGFKSWNELLGHSNANEILRQVAVNIMDSELNPIIGARTNADHFWFLVDRKMVNYDEISRLCNQKVVINENETGIRLNCGIYEIDDKTQDVLGMCDKAAIAETHISNEYAAPYYTFDNKALEAYVNQTFVMNNLERAFLHNEFKVYYQPVFDTKTKQIASAEALVRWQQVGEKIVSPGVFIPVLEEKGHISQLDLFMEMDVQRFLEQRQAAGKKNVPVSLNLSRMDFLNDEFMRKLGENVDKTTLKRNLLRFEVTESAYINVGNAGTSLLEKLRNEGSKIYIDDFGTGYSSLKNLMEVEFDVLKIDMVFIKKIGINRLSEEIIKSAIEISHNLNKKVIAEGVETDLQYEFLLKADCDYIQGFYFSKPLNEAEFAKMLEQ